MNYMTRHMVARQAFRHEGRELTPGDDFHPTDVDAKYYERSGLADPVRAKPAAPQRRGKPAEEAAPPPAAPTAREAPAPATPPATEGENQQ